MSTVLHDVINPATEEVVTSVELLDTDATDAAIARSRKAFRSLAQLSRPATGPGCCAASPTRSTPTASTWPASK